MSSQALPSTSNSTDITAACSFSVVGACPVHCRVFHASLVSDPLDASSTISPVININVIRHITIILEPVFSEEFSKSQDHTSGGVTKKASGLHL